MQCELEQLKKELDSQVQNSKDEVNECMVCIFYSLP